MDDVEPGYYLQRPIEGRNHQPVQMTPAWVAQSSCNELRAFLKRQQGMQQLNLSTMTLVELRRHAMALVCSTMPDSCALALSPYASHGRAELERQAKHFGIQWWSQKEEEDDAGNSHHDTSEDDEHLDNVYRQDDDQTSSDVDEVLHELPGEKAKDECVVAAAQDDEQSADDSQSIAPLVESTRFVQKQKTVFAPTSALAAAMKAAGAASFSSAPSSSSSSVSAPASLLSSGLDEQVVVAAASDDEHSVDDRQTIAPLVESTRFVPKQEATPFPTSLAAAMKTAGAASSSSAPPPSSASAPASLLSCSTPESGFGKYQNVRLTQSMSSLEQHSYSSPSRFASSVLCGDQVSMTSLVNRLSSSGNHDEIKDVLVESDDYQVIDAIDWLESNNDVEALEALCIRVSARINAMPMKFERLRREETDKVLLVLQSVFGPFRFAEEARDILSWCRLDHFAMTSAHVELVTTRIEWLERIHNQFQLKFAHKTATFLSRHVAPFLRHRSDLIPSHLATWENLGIARTLETPFLIAKLNSHGASSGATFFADIIAQYQVPVDQLRQPQQDALQALGREWSSPSESDNASAEDRSLETNPKHRSEILQAAYEQLICLRSVFCRLLEKSYKQQNCSSEVSQLEECRNTCARHTVVEQIAQPLMVVLPTGVGKTVVACLAPLYMSPQPKRVLVVSPNNIIRENLASSYSSVYAWLFPLSRSPRVVKFHAGYNKRALLQGEVFVTNIQTLSSRVLLSELPCNFFQLVIIDEAHHAPAKSYQLLREHFQCRFLYLTATPYRGDAQAVRARCVYHCDMATAIENGFIRNVCFMPVPVASLTVCGYDHQETLFMENIAQRSDELFSVVRYSADCKLVTLRFARDRILQLRATSTMRHQCIIQASDLEEARELIELWRRDMQEDSLTIEMVGSHLPDATNAQVLAQLARGELDVIVHVGMLGEGFDHPHLTVCVVFRRFGSLAPFAQLIGRVLRRGAEDDVPQAYVIAHPGLGLHRHWRVYASRQQHPELHSLARRRPSNVHWVSVCNHTLHSEAAVQWY